MNFNKKAIGNALDREYIWVSSRRKHQFIIRLDKEKYCYWFEVIKDEQTVFNSLQNNMCYNTLEEASANAEIWADVNICGKPLRKSRMSVESKYNLLVHAIRSVCEKYENLEAAKELKAVLAKIGEDESANG